MSPVRLVLAAALGVVCAVLVACGGSTDHLIPSDDAAKIEKQLASLQSQVEQGQCVGVGADVGRLTKAVDTLPTSVDVDLRDRLDAGVRNLARIAPPACQAVDTVTQTTPAVTTDTTSTETIETTPETTPTPTEPESEPTPTEPEPDPTPTTETREDTLPGTEPPPPSDDTGGAVAP